MTPVTNNNETPPGKSNLKKLLNIVTKPRKRWEGMTKYVSMTGNYDKNKPYPLSYDRI